MGTKTRRSLSPFWSAWFEYAATGEGMTIGVMYCLGGSEEDAAEQAMVAFGKYYGLACEIENGLKTDGYFSHYVPPAVLEHYQGIMDGTKTAGWTSWHGVFHINYS